LKLAALTKLDSYDQWKKERSRSLSKFSSLLVTAEYNSEAPVYEELRTWGVIGGKP